MYIAACAECGYGRCTSRDFHNTMKNLTISAGDKKIFSDVWCLMAGKFLVYQYFDVLLVCSFLNVMCRFVGSCLVQLGKNLEL